MAFKIPLFFLRYLTYCTLINSSYGSALIGDTVQKAKSNEFPSVVSISKKEPCPETMKNIHYCTGTLISERHVLTAAHCIHGFNITDIVVIAGNTDPQNGTQYPIKKWITYDEWQFGPKDDLEAEPYNDIAIISLVKRIIDKNIMQAKILQFSPQDVYMSKIRIVGWGRSTDGTATQVLKTGVVQVITNSECESLLELLTNQITQISEDYFCSRAKPYVLSSNGDSGAPLFNKQKQVVGINIGACPQKRQMCKYTEEFTCHNQVNLHLNLYGYRQFIFCIIFDNQTECQIAMKLKKVPLAEERSKYSNYSPLNRLH